MPTPGEQKALAFVAIVIALGGAVRIYRSGAESGRTATVAEQQALARQSGAAESLAASTRRPRGKGVRQRGVARIDADTGAMKPQHGFPPPGPRIDVGPAPAVPPASSSAPGPASGAAFKRSVRRVAPTAPIDVDVASAAELEALPRVGPALARRIVASRDSAGPFGSLEALRRVRGVGPATLELLRPLVTFSGQTRR